MKFSLFLNLQLHILLLLLFVYSESAAISCWMPQCFTGDKDTDTGMPWDETERH